MTMPMVGGLAGRRFFGVLRRAVALVVLSAAGLAQAALLSLETVWSTGLKEPAAWQRLQSLATVAIPESVRASAMQAEKKIASLRK